jgi:nucleolar protein 58
MKTKHDTPKYGLIYHASLVGQTSAKLKGKVSRMLAAKASLAIRVDALGEDTQATLGIEQRADLERKFALLEQNAVRFDVLKFVFFFIEFFVISVKTYIRYR